MMGKKKLIRMAQMVGQLLDEDLPKEFSRLSKEQLTIVQALKKHPKQIQKLPNVVGVGVGFHYQRGRRKNVIGPVVYVKRKVPKAQLRPADRIPSTIEIAGKRHRVDVIVLGKVKPLCLPGVPDTQHQAFDPIPPGVAICGIDPTNGNIVTRGTGGAIVRRTADTSSSPARALLTARHIIFLDKPLTLGQPWTNRAVGGFFAASATLDAAVAEIQNPTPAFHCFGSVRPPIQPIVGMAVKKSGARTGVTGSVVVAILASVPGFPGNAVVIDNEAQFPPSDPAFVSNFAGLGDSGSVALLGNPANPDDFGPTVNQLIDRFLRRVPRPLQRSARMAIRFRLTNAAIALIVRLGVPTPPTPPRVCLGHPMDAVLTDMQITLL